MSRTRFIFGDAVDMLARMHKIVVASLIVQIHIYICIYNTYPEYINKLCLTYFNWVYLRYLQFLGRCIMCVGNDVILSMILQQTRCTQGKLECCIVWEHTSWWSNIFTRTFCVKKIIHNSLYYHTWRLNWL